MAIERLLLRRIYRLDHMYGLLLTFGILTFIQGLFVWLFATAGRPYPVPPELRGGFDLGFMFLPTYRAWVVVASLVYSVCDVARHREDAARPHLARRDREPAPDARLRRQRAGADDVRFRRRRCACRRRRLARRTDLFGQPADGRRSRHRRVRRRRHRRHGLDPRLDRHQPHRSACSKGWRRWSIRQGRTW